MQVTSAKDYRKGKTKLVPLPSGAVFKIGKPDGVAMAEMLSMFDVPIKMGSSPESVQRTFEDEMSKIDIKEKLADFLKLLIPACCIDPRVTINPKEKSDEVLLLQEVEQEDSFALIDAIMEFSGFRVPSSETEGTTEQNTTS